MIVISTLTLLGTEIVLARLLLYFAELQSTVDRIYSETLTWENIYDQPFDLGVKHPQWVEEHFPLNLILYREKAGKLRNSKSVDIMFQNNFNLMTQVVCTPSNFGIYYRKNKHKGFGNIIGAIKIPRSEIKYLLRDKQKPVKYKNFDDFNNRFGKGDPFIKIFCDVLKENYACDSYGQLKLL